MSLGRNGAHGAYSGVGETTVPHGVMNEERDRMVNKRLERMKKQMEAFTTILQGFKEGQWGNDEKF